MAKSRKKIRVPAKAPHSSRDIILGAEQDATSYRNTPFSLSFRHTQVGSYCLSDCNKMTTKKMLACLVKAHRHTWGQLYDKGGRPGDKVGLAFTEYEDHALRKVRRPDKLPEDAKIASLRASDKLRIVGAKAGVTFLVLWFDKDHILLA